jgi:hypothetical protein
MDLLRCEYAGIRRRFSAGEPIGKGDAGNALRKREIDATGNARAA